jgi:hypothetical protein
MVVKRVSSLSSQGKVAINADLPDNWSADESQAEQKPANGISGIPRLGLDSQPASESSQEMPINGDREMNIEKIRAFMIKLVTSLSREAFRGIWRDQWLKRKMRETVEKIETGSLKELCRVFLKVEMEMNWKALSEEFSKNRTRILCAFGKCSAAVEVYRELVFFSRELNPKYLHDGCELLSEATLEVLKLNERCWSKDEQEINAGSVDKCDSTSTQCLLDTARLQQGLRSPSKVPGENDVASSEENESKKTFEDNSPPKSASYLDSTLVWVLYRKKEWWPAQVVHSVDYPSDHAVLLKPTVSRENQVVTGRELCRVPDILIQKYSNSQSMGKIVLYFDG